VGLFLLAVFCATAIAAASNPANASPVNAWLPGHAAVVDGNGRLLPWTGYDRVLGLGWRFLEHVPVDTRAGVKTYLAYAVFDPDTGLGRYWQHNPASLYASLVESLLPWHAYSGDNQAVEAVRDMLDYQLAHGTTPSGWAWPRVPFATSCAGAREYGRCLAGADRRFYGGIEPDKVGLLGLGYLHFYELTGDRRYLAAAAACGRALARHVRPGSNSRTPWAFRIDGRTGRTFAGAEYGGMIVAPVQLLDELARLGGPESRAYARARDVAWRWVLRHQLDPRNADFNRWSGYYEDIAFSPDDLNQAAPTTTAEWLLTSPTARRLDPDSLVHARRLLAWVRGYLGRGPFDGAWAIDEQRTPGRTGCCSQAGVGSDTARWAAVTALLAERTHDRPLRREALRSLAYATYFTDRDGRVSCCGGKGSNAYWFSDGYGDYLSSFSRALAALPGLAGRGQTHLLSSTSVVQQVRYGGRWLAYRTFARASVETMRLAFLPRRVLADGRRLNRRRSLTAQGYTLTPAAGGFVVRVRHDRARHVVLAA
jgi:hypothetical protein